MIRVRTDTLANRMDCAPKMCVLNRYILTGNLIPSLTVSSGKSRWSYKDVTDHFLTTEPAASQPGRREGNGKSPPPRRAERTAVVVHQGGTSGHSVCSKHRVAVN